MDFKSIISGFQLQWENKSAAKKEMDEQNSLKKKSCQHLYYFLYWHTHRQTGHLETNASVTDQLEKLTLLMMTLALTLVCSDSSFR